ncbi:hypothetical protein MFLAVUS_008720 [Mucor flavus]|uniref:YncI copper-binding domain-containing protein n=1 Tax=Mucor flavus TaxID=439312 RepID=A0ABP9Z7Z9_9FUNG
MVFTTRAALIVSAFAAAISSVHAHINLSPKYAEPNQVLNTMFHVPHGCNGSSTVSISVTVPETVTNITARPVEKWTLATAYRDSSNASVSTITWSGGLLKGTDALDFPIILTVPNVDLSSQANVSFYFPVVQTCEVGSINWTSTSTAHGSADGEPAPALIVVKNATQAAADALAIKGTASASAPAPTATGNSGNQIYAGLLPVVAAIAALSISL